MNMTLSRASLEVACCRSCGRHAYPYQLPACPHCGAESGQLEHQSLSGPFELRNSVTLHVNLVPGLPAPVSIGEAELLPGWVEQVVIADAASGDLEPGALLWPWRSGVEDQALQFVFKTSEAA